MEDKESQQFDSEILKFPNGRQNLMVEIGPGGPSTLMLRNMPKYLEDNDANYLVVEPDYKYNETYKQFIGNRNINYAKNYNGGVFEIAPQIKGQASEVLVRNFRGIGKGRDSELENKLFSAAYEMVKPGGKFMVLNTYDILPEGGVEKVKQELENVGFTVEEIDMDNDTHPLVADHRRLEEQMPPDIGPKPTRYGFRAIKD